MALLCIGRLKLKERIVRQWPKMQILTVKTIVEVNSDFRFRIYSVESTWKVEKYQKFQKDEENIRILSIVFGLEKHEYSKNMENLEMP